MTNKIGSVVLLLTCIFISLGFGLLFQNKITLEGYTTKDSIMDEFKKSIEAQITADKMKKMKESNNDYATSINKFEDIMKEIEDIMKEIEDIMNKIKPQPNDEISIKYYNTIIIECINYIIGLKLHITLNTDYHEGRINRLKYMKNFIILPNEPIDQAPEIIKKLDSIFMQTDKINKEKIKEIKTLVKTFAEK
jgi:hypothetical protein